MNVFIASAVCGLCTVPSHWGSSCRQSVVNRLYYIVSGKGGYVVNGVKYPFEAGKMYFLPQMAGARTYFDASDPLTHAYCDFEMLPMSDNLQVSFINPHGDLVNEAALDLFLTVCKQATAFGAEGRNRIPSKALEELFNSTIYYFITQFVDEKQIDVQIDESIFTALKYVHENINKKITVSELARLVYMSDGGFIKRFKLVTGFTPYGYLKTLRLRTAEYLKESGHTLEEIAERIGYSDSVSLLHALKKIK